MCLDGPGQIFLMRLLMRLDGQYALVRRLNAGLNLDRIRY